MADEPEADMKLVANERTKLSATYVNGLAIALVAVGGFAPIFAGDFSHMDATGIASFAARLFGCLVVSGFLHFRGRSLLKDLR